MTTDSTRRWRKSKTAIAIMIAILAAPFLLMMLFAGMSGERR